MSRPIFVRFGDVDLGDVVYGDGHVFRVDEIERSGPSTFLTSHESQITVSGRTRGFIQLEEASDL